MDCPLYYDLAPSLSRVRGLVTLESIQCRFVFLRLRQTTTLAAVVEEFREPFHHVADASMP